MLKHAAESNDLDIVKILFKTKTLCVNAQFLFDRMLLHSTVKQENLEIVRYLAKNKADIMAQSESNQTLLAQSSR
ncbi:MAG: ankyrin repeat domain-containing protein [Rickettsiaceae bacterium H1]|nr:ankyrin repeat domain-containing protein [Rickettsiaceae bacterium H1]